MIRETTLGWDHPETAISLYNLGTLCWDQGNLGSARSYLDRALAVFERKLGLMHPNTQTAARNAASLLDDLELPNEAAAIRKKFGLTNDH